MMTLFMTGYQILMWLAFTLYIAYKYVELG